MNKLHAEQVASITVSITQPIPAIGDVLPDTAGSAVLTHRAHDELASPFSKDFLRNMANGYASCRNTHTITTAVNTQTFDDEERQSSLHQKDIKK